jgi:hypothetical protein
MPPITVSTYGKGRVEVVPSREGPAPEIARAIDSALPEGAGQDLASAMAGGAVKFEGQPGATVSTAQLTAGIVGDSTGPNTDDTLGVDETSAIEDAFVESAEVADMGVAERFSVPSIYVAAGFSLPYGGLKPSATRLVNDLAAPFRAVADFFRSLGDEIFGAQVMLAGAAWAGGLMGPDLPLIISAASTGGGGAPDRVLPPLLSERPDRERYIPAKRAKKMRKYFARREKGNLFDKVLANFRMIGEAEFAAGLDAMSKAVTDFIAGDPYYVVVNDRGGSQTFVLSRLNLPYPPEAVIWVTNDEPIPNPDYKLVFVDDAAYSGGQVIGEILRNLPDYKKTAAEGRLMLAFVGITDKAEGWFKKSGVENIFASYKIPTLNQIFTPWEVTALARIIGRRSNVPETGAENVLTFLYYKVPDNLYDGLRKDDPVSKSPDRNLYLLDDTPGGIYPPYRTP